MKSTFLLMILAVVPAALMPAAATCQAAPDAAAGPGAARPRVYKYEAFAGYGYTQLNQVNLSRYGLQGFKVSVGRNWKYLGVVGLGDFYKYPTGFAGGGNPGKPVVMSALGGMDVHSTLYGPLSGYFRALMGGEHTGGENMTPTISFAGGVGVGMDYTLNPRWALRASGDWIGAAFTVRNNTNALGYSPHTNWNLRASIGLVYRF